MADLGVKLSDDRMRQLMKRLDGVYGEAYQKAWENNQNAILKLNQIKQDIESGKYGNLSKEQQKAKIKTYTMQQIRTEQIVDNISAEIAGVGDTARDIIRGELNGLYALNFDFSNYSIQKQSGLDLNFSIFDRNQIAVLLQETESPFTKIAYERLGFKDPTEISDLNRRLQNHLIAATVNGESQQQIMQRIRKVTNQTAAQAKRVAQTERTRVQTQARVMSINEAEAMGIEMEKQWLARLIRTRESHIDVHGEIKKAGESFSNGLEYPGDPSGAPESVINCHCYIKPMVKNVGAAMAAHRADIQAMEFEKYQQRLKSSQQNDTINYTGFSNVKTLNAHVKKHLDEYSGATKKDYVDRARELLNAPTSDSVLGFRGNNGKTYRYDVKNNDFAVGNKHGTIATLFKPKNKLKYWEGQVKKYEKT